jgi:hypothetical protein
MLHSLRTVALLMLVAGVSLGVFASTLMAEKPSASTVQLDQRIEERVKLYREFYDLDDARTDAIRRELNRQRREMRDLVLDLRQRHAAEFDQLVKGTEERVKAILKDSR